MKHLLWLIVLMLIVAPHVGAWIETATVMQMYMGQRVAPHVGAWIETIISYDNVGEAFVAPHVGAWIETNPSDGLQPEMRASHPTWVRGLKPAFQ